MAEPVPSAFETVAAHSRTAKLMHWGFVGLFVFALTKQLDEVEELEDHFLLQYEMIFASVFLMLLIMRFIYMRSTRPTVLPSQTPTHIKRLATLVHLGMYACLGLIPSTGLWIGGLYWTGTKSGAVMDAALLLHEIAVNTSYFLILGHIIASIYHRQKGDGIWDAMVPIWKERREP